MFRRSNSVHIDAPPEAIFDYVSDFTRHPEWAHEKIEIESVEGTGPGAGARYQTIVHFMGTVPGEINVVESEPPRRLVYKCGDKASRYRWTFELQPEGSGTKVMHSFERLKEAKWFMPIQPVLYPILGKKMAAGGLANIKAKVEAAKETSA